MSLRQLLVRALALLTLAGLCQQETALIFAQTKAQEPWDVTKARGATREIEFDTSEGTWMSLSLSPDGKWIVFDLLAHVYRIPASGGKAECLTQTSGVALNYQPRYSPDGKSIAFISDRGGQDNLWIMDADGGHPRTVFDDKDIRVREPAWTPDGQYILVRRDSVATGLEPPPPSGIWMYNREGGKGLEVIGKDEKGADWPSSSGDGKYIYYYYVAGDPSSYAGRADSTQGYYQIKRLELRTSEISEITGGVAEQQYRSSNGGAIAPEISPDGHWLAFSRRIPNGTISYKGHTFGPRSALWLRDMNTGAERVAMDPIEVEMAEQYGTPRILPGYSWAADSKSIVISQGGKIHRLWIDSGKVESIPFEAHVQRTISEMAKAERRIDDGPFAAQFAR
jgi:Tol biopolymer transport system component